MTRHDVVKRHDFRSAMKSKEKLSSMKSVRFDGIYNGKEAEVGHGGGVSTCIYACHTPRLMLVSWYRVSDPTVLTATISNTKDTCKTAADGLPTSRF